MSFVQKLFKKFVSRKTFQAMEKDSRRWHFFCTCGWQISVWDAGGIRYKGASVGKKTLGRCPHCKRLRWLSCKKV